MSTSEQVALVTEPSRGIGAEIARRLARDGFRVVVAVPAAQDVVDARRRRRRPSRCRRTSPIRPPWPRCSTRPSRHSAGSTSWSTARA